MTGGEPPFLISEEVRCVERELKSDYAWDEESGEASGHCRFCGENCVCTDNFGRDNCIKLLDKTWQTPEVIGIWCSVGCFWNDMRRQLDSEE